MPKRIRVNIKTRVNAANIKHEKRDGRDVIRVPSATLPDNVVMNRVLYPADEIAKSFHTLENTLAPIGHPMVGNQYVPALHPAALAGYYAGVHNENVRREHGRVFLDKIIDVARAKESEKGRALLEAIEKGDPIHTSTGVLVNLKPANHPDYDHIATDMLFDHDAILLSEQGAATPEQGVGMLVNAEDGTPENVDVMDVDLDDEDLNQIAESAAAAIGWRIEEEERKERFKSLAAKIKELLRSVGLTANTATGHHKTDSEEDPMPITDEQFKKLEDQVTSLTNSVANIGDTVAQAIAQAIAPITTSIATLEANAKAAEEAEREKLVQTVVKANLLSEEVAKSLQTNALRELAAKATPGQAASIFGAAFNANSANDQVSAGSFMDNIKAAGGDK